MSTELIEKVAKLETRVDSHDKLIAAYRENDITLAKITTLFEVQVEENKKQNETMESFGKVLQNVDKNLSQLNYTQEKLKNQIEDMNNRVSSVESEIQMDNKATTIDLKDFPKKAILWVVGLLLGALTLYVYIKLGLK